MIFYFFNSYYIMVPGLIFVRQWDSGQMRCLWSDLTMNHVSDIAMGKGGAVKMMSLTGKEEN